MRGRLARFAVSVSVSAAAAALASCSSAFETPASVVSELSVVPAPDGAADALRFDDEADPINLFMVDYPRAGDVLPPSFDVVCFIRVDNQERFNAQFSDATLCVELSGAGTQCEPMMQSHIRLESVGIGTHRLTAFISINATKYRETPAVSFYVVAPEDAVSHTEQLAERLRSKHGLSFDQDAVSWARSERVNDARATPLPIVTGSPTPTLLVGVKTALSTNFHMRQAIRETWASNQSLPSGVRVVFIGCRPNLNSVDNPNDRHDLIYAIEREKRVFGDLLTDELDCDDSYDDLPSKVAEFMRWGVDHFESSLSHVMIADDDIYLRTEAFERELQLLSGRRRVYAGQVWTTMFNRPTRPIRDPGTRYHLPEEVYPMSTLPPFAFGPHFVVSVDCAKFIGKNSRRLSGLSGMDDISVALWMLAIQVHPQHMGKLRNVRASGCTDNLISLADLSSLAIRVIHENLKTGRAFCSDFDKAVWVKPETQRRIGEAAEALVLTSLLRDIRLTREIQVVTTVNGVEFLYIPSIETLAHYSNRVCERLKQTDPSAKLSCAKVAARLTDHHQSFYTRTHALGKFETSRTELWRHNLFDADPESPPVYIAYTSGASYSHTLFECLFTAIYRSNAVLVASAETLMDMHHTQPDITVFSILDSVWPERQRLLSRTSSRLNPRAKTLMFSGESWGTGRLDDDVILLSTVSDAPQATHHVYISMASASFAERLDHSPLDLLSSWTVRTQRENSRATRRFCAFLYSKCDWPHRQYFYDALNSLEPVDAIGKCAGALKPLEQHEKLASRLSRWYLDDAVSQYERYKFVVAFENSISPGYVTEKVVNAFLAGAIPIFWGNSTSLASLFNPRSYIDCGDFPTLRQCATRVIEVHESADEYEKMRRAPPIVDVAAFYDAFSWHPGVPSNATASAIARHLFA